MTRQEPEQALHPISRDYPPLEAMGGASGLTSYLILYIPLTIHRLVFSHISRVAQ